MDAGTRRSTLLRFAAFEMDLESAELRKAGRLISLPPQPFKVLRLLATRAGELVTREDIQNEIWGNETVVDFERGLNFAIRKIRTALGDSADSPRYVETLPRRGYRFLCPVEAVTSAPEEGVPATSPPAVSVPPPRRLAGRFFLPAAVSAIAISLVLLANLPALRQALAPSKTARIQTVAVLPFENLSHVAGDAFLADGTTDTLIAELGRVSALRVISRTSSIQYRNSHKLLPQVGRELGADAVVEGSVLRSGDHLRITVQLMEAATDRQFWSESYDRKLGDVITLQGEVARSIAEAVRARLTPGERDRLARARPVNPEAFERYLHGRFFWNKMTADGLNRSIADFEQAIAKDPGYALAYAGLADCYAAAPFTLGMPAREAYRKAKEAASKALEIDPTLAEAVTTLATVAAYGYDWPEAEKLFKRALDLNPSYAQAHHDFGFYFLAMGRIDEGTATNQEALKLDPLSLYFKTDLAWQPYFLRQYDDGIRQLKQVLEMDSAYVPALGSLGVVYQAKGMAEEGIEQFRKALQHDPDNPFTLALMGNAYAQAGNTKEARHILQQLEEMKNKRPVSAFHFAFIQMGLGNKDQAFELFAKACEERFYFMALLNVAPFFDPIRSDPRFAGLVKRVGLPAR